MQRWNWEALSMLNDSAHLNTQKRFLPFFHTLQSYTYSDAEKNANAGLWEFRLWEFRLWELRLWGFRFWGFRLWGFRLWWFRLFGFWLLELSRVETESKTWVEDSGGATLNVASCGAGGGTIEVDAFKVNHQHWHWVEHENEHQCHKYFLQ